MMRTRLLTIAVMAVLAATDTALAIGPSDREKPPTTTQVMESAQPSDWRRPGS